MSRRLPARTSPTALPRKAMNITAFTPMRGISTVDTPMPMPIAVVSGMYASPVFSGE